MENSYNKRIVDYESVHRITQSSFDLFVSSINPIVGESILDVGAGYGAATREMIIRNQNEPIDYILLEKSSVQLERAKAELKKFTSTDFFKNKIRFVEGTIQNHPFDSESFDKVVAKSFIHEIPEKEKLSSFKNIYKILKKDGRFIIWNYVLDDINCDYIRNMIRKKDEFAGYNELVKERHFPTEKEILDTLGSAGFEDIKEEHGFRYTHHSFSRLGEFNNDMNLLKIYNDFLIESFEQLDQRSKDHLNFKIKGDDITVEMKQSIITASKKEI
jgi:ubiquinone/menaquinone biosynthesis C-methylase UbiE